MKIYEEAPIDNYAQPQFEQRFSTLERPKKSKLDDSYYNDFSLPQIAMPSSNTSKKALKEHPWQNQAVSGHDDMNTEKLLYEHDPHLLEEKRYFARLNPGFPLYSPV